jgi:hypothetical protein
MTVFHQNCWRRRPLILAAALKAAGWSLAIVLSRRHTGRALREIGERCGGSDYAAVSQAQHRMEMTLRHTPRLAATANDPHLLFEVEGFSVKPEEK